MLTKIILKLLLLRFAASSELYCNFLQHIDGYNCEIISSFKDNITSINGRHFSNKTNADVEVVFAPLRSNITDFPSGACQHFENLAKFDINGVQVSELSRLIFHGCRKVQQVNIMYTKIKEFEENLFYDLTSLEVLVISENSLEHLQKDLLKYNRQLRTLDLSYNKITSISTIIPASVIIVKVFNNPCADRSFYPKDFNKVHELCPDENKRLSLNLTDTMSKFQELHLLIMKTSSKLDDFHSIADSALTELDERLNAVEKQGIASEKNSKNIENEAMEKDKAIASLERDLKIMTINLEKQNREIQSLKELQKASFDRIKDQINELQHVDTFSNEGSKFDHILEKEALESTFSADRKFIYLAFAMNALLMAIFILFAFMKINRPSKRDAMLLNAFDS